MVIVLRLVLLLVFLLLVWCGWLVLQWLVVQGLVRAWHALGAVPEPVLRGAVMGMLIVLLIRLVLALALLDGVLGVLGRLIRPVVLFLLGGGP